jgi:hypothetical protein
MYKAFHQGDFQFRAHSDDLEHANARERQLVSVRTCYDEALLRLHLTRRDRDHTPSLTNASRSQTPNSLRPKAFSFTRAYSKNSFTYTRSQPNCQPDRQTSLFTQLTTRSQDAAPQALGG